MSKKSIRQEAQERLMPNFKGLALSEGNKKLPQDHLILNLTSAHHCPSDRLGMCAVSKICYAKRLEEFRSEYRYKNEMVEEWLNTATDEQIFELIKVYAQTSVRPIRGLRLNEAGDFRDQEQVNQMSRIAKRLKNELGITTYAWSARKDLDFTDVNIIINGSSEDVKGAMRVFKAVPKDIFKALPRGTMTCGGSRGLSCRNCHLCHRDKFHGTIYVLNH